MPRSRTTKTIAKRIDLGYFKRPHPMRTWRRALTWLAGIAALVWLSIVSVRFTGGKIAMNDRIHNPGHVTPAHAMFENDCKQCHAPKAGGGFVLSVTDSACLKCHDGAIHHPNQKVAVEASLVSRSKKLLALDDGGHPRAANCATCHVEHRGRELLSATSDAHCVVCHGDLTDATKDAKPQAASHVVAFNLNDHPKFGRKLSGGDQTPLKFNHKYHLEKVDEIRNNPANCVTCHTPDPANRRYMLPISYAKNCKECHELSPLSEIDAKVAHEEMSLVRYQLLNLSPLFEQALHAMPRVQREAQLVKKVQTGRRTTTQPITEQQWLEEKLAAAKKQAGEWMESDEARKTPGYDHAKNDESRLMEYYVAFGMSQSCAKCHDVKSETYLTTAPTKIGASPRRWFAASMFDHDAHRSESCRGCHEAAWTSELTKDVLMPDIKGCVDCHHAPVAASRGAPADCVMCHTFHDRSFERRASISQAPSP